MAIDVTSLADGVSNAGTSSYSTASFTPASNQLVLVVIGALLTSGNGPGAVTAVSGNGLTWQLIAATSFGDVQGSGNTARIEVWGAMGASPSNSALSFSFATNPANVCWGVCEFSGLNTTSVNDAVAQSKVNSVAVNTVSPATVTMGSFLGAANGTYGAVACIGNNILSAGSGLTEIDHDGGGVSFENTWASGNVSSVTSTYTGSLRWGIVGIELNTIPPGDTVSMKNQWQVNVG